MTESDPFAAAPPDLRELLALASDLALQAGRIHAEGRREALRIETKSSPTDLVSQVDRAAERLIVDRLRERTSGRRHPRRRRNVARRDERGALGRRPPGRDDQLRLRLPRLLRLHRGRDRRRSPGRAWSSTRARGGCTGRWRARARCATTARSGRACPRDWRRPSSPPASRTLRLSASSRARWWRPCWAASGTSAAAARAALDLCRLAAGEVDAYWELDLSPWDFAAGVLIAREAGAEVRAGAGRAAAPAAPSSARTRRSCPPSPPCCARPARWPDRGGEPRGAPRRRRLSRAAPSSSSGASMTTAAPLSTSSSGVRKPHAAPTAIMPAAASPCACPPASRRGRRRAPEAARSGRRSRARPPGRA